MNGQSITVTGARNQSIPLLVGSLIINEQTSSVTNSPNGASADMVVKIVVPMSGSRLGGCKGVMCMSVVQSPKSLASPLIARSSNSLLRRSESSSANA